MTTIFTKAKITRSLILLGASLTFAGISTLSASAKFENSLNDDIPSKTQTINTNQAKNDQPNSYLLKALRKTLTTKYNEDEVKYYFAEVKYYFAEVDLNNDGIKEAIIYFVGNAGTLCNNRYCPVYIFQKQKNSVNYRFVSEIYINHEAPLFLLSRRSKGWLSFGAGIFNYQPRGVDLREFKFDGKTYKITSEKLNFTPNRILIDPEKAIKHNLSDIK